MAKLFNFNPSWASLLILSLSGSPSPVPVQTRTLRAKDYLPKTDVNRVMQSPKSDWGMESRATLGPKNSTVDRSEVFRNHAHVSSYEELFHFYSDGFDSFTKATGGAQMLEESLREPIRVGTEWTATDQGEVGKLRIISIGDMKTRAGMLRNVVAVRLYGFHLHRVMRNAVYKCYAPGLGVVRIEAYNSERKSRDLVLELTAYK